MDQRYIDEREVIERYLRGKLSDAEEQAFEEAYLGNPQLLDELERAEGLQRGLREIEALGGHEKPKRTNAWSSVFQSPRYALAASMALAASLVLSSVLYLDNQNLRTQGSLAANMPVANVLPLLTTRGGGTVNELAAPDPDTLTVLLVDAGLEDYDTYEVTVAREIDDSPLTVVARDGLTSSLIEGIPRVPIAIEGRALTPGAYSVQLFGRMDDWPASRASVPIAEYDLSVKQQQ